VTSTSDSERTDSEPSADEAEPKPTVKQLIHWATGDRDAEAKELVKASPDDVTLDDAVVAVKRAHGDVPDPAPAASEVATASDAEAVHEERSE
jgi:hypothetical protein